MNQDYVFLCGVMWAQYAFPKMRAGNWFGHYAAAIQKWHI